MGIWIGKPALADGEPVLWQHLANRTQSANRAVGGRLYLTPHRLLFEANRVDAATGGRPWSVPLDHIRSVGRQPRDGNRLNGGLRDRLKLDLADESVELFVVNRLDTAVRVIQEAVSQSAGQPSEPPRAG